MKKVQKPLTATESGVLKTLENFRFSPRTNLTDKRISNHDAACCILYVCGQMSSGRLTHLLRIWRARSAVKAVANTYRWTLPPTMPVLASQVKRAHAAMRLQFTYLFNAGDGPGYGFVGKGLDSKSNELWKFTYDKKTIINRPTYWYRRAPGLYGCTTLGWKHGFYLHTQLKGILIDVA